MNKVFILPNSTPAASLQIHIVLFIGHPYIAFKYEQQNCCNLQQNILPTTKETHV